MDSRGVRRCLVFFNTVYSAIQNFLIHQIPYVRYSQPNWAVRQTVRTVTPEATDLWRDHLEVSCFSVIWFKRLRRTDEWYFFVLL
jgi:hypothetical protein